MITIFSSAKLTKISPQMVLAVIIIREHIPDLIIRYGEDGVHSEKSKHPDGDAIDFRTKHLYAGDLLREEHLYRMVGRIKVSLGPDYDVVLEDVNKPNEHLHVEYDPK